MQLLEFIHYNKLYLAILALPTVSSMLYDFFQKGMIFERYGNWVFKEDYYNDAINEKQDALRSQIENAEPGTEIQPLLDDIDSLQAQKIPTPAIKKPLGNCLKCFHVWVVVAFTLIFQLTLWTWLINDWTAFYKWFLSLSISYFILIHNNYK